MKPGNVRICLKLAGRKSQRTFKIFVFKGKKQVIIEKIGFITPAYNSHTDKILIGLNFKRFYYWYGKGASISPRLELILIDLINFKKW